MEKLQDAELPVRSLAVHTMILTPTGNVVVPKRGHDTVTPPPTSVAVAGLQLTTPVGAFKEVEAVMLSGQLICGGVTSANTTLKLQDAVLLEVSDALQKTLVVPSTKLDPDAGKHLTEATATLSIAVAIGYTTGATLAPNGGEND